MFRGFYTAASGMIAQQRLTDMLTNNISNANTPGFKEDQGALRAFPDLLMERMNESGTNNSKIGHLNTGVYMQQTIPNFVQGDVQQTGVKTDMALVNINMPTNGANGVKGSVFFTVQDPSGQLRYTRDGNFTLDPEGYLTNSEGLYILDNKGQHIHLSSDQFTVGDNGEIVGSNGERATLGVGFSNDPDSLIKEGTGLYRTSNNAPLPSATSQAGIQFKVQQGALEQSNVDMDKTMTDMLNAYRTFEANQKVLQAYDQSMQKAANDVGKVG